MQSTDSQKAADEELEELNEMSDSSDEFEVEASDEEHVFVVNSHDHVTAGGTVHGDEKDVLEGVEWKFDGEYEAEELMNMDLPPQPSVSDVSQLLQPLDNGVDKSYSESSSDGDTPFEGMIVKTTGGDAPVPPPNMFLQRSLS